uniref:Syntaxin-5-like n=1 Tax=Phallusia mammillata TaxID=59560 RepID=A0A6F9DUM4_9ASCI|nr:syntaxin-5-like [Phallusia mammillata]
MAARHRFSTNSPQTGNWSITQTLSPSTYTKDTDSDDHHSDCGEDLVITMSIASRDRTTEFQSVLKSLKSRQSNGTALHQSPKVTLKRHSEFSKFAKNIGQDLARTYEKLEKLTLLCKKRSLFDDRPVEIQELTYIIKKDITSLKRKIQQLEESKTASLPVARKDAQRHTTSIVRTLRSKLAHMSENFKSVLEVRRENMKQQKLRKDQFSSTNLSASMPPSATQGNSGSVLLMDEQRSESGRSGSVAISMDGSSAGQTMQLVEQQDAYISDRANTMETIETTIVELGNIFQQLATMVKEQEEQVLRIDSNMEESELNIEAAHTEILKYFQGITSNRWLMIKVFLVLIVFFIVFVFSLPKVTTTLCISFSISRI